MHLLGSIVKRGGGVLHGCYCHYHIGSEDCTVRAFKALRLDLKYLAHKHSVFKFIIYNCSCFSAETANHLLSRGKDYANERNESLLSNCRVQLIFCKARKNLMSHQIFNKKSYGILLYFTSQGLHSLLLPASIPCNYSAPLLKTLNRKALKNESGFISS